MKRAETLVDVALEIALVDMTTEGEILGQYRESAATIPNFSFEAWAVAAQLFTLEEAELLLAQFEKARFRCNLCGVNFSGAEAGVAGEHLVCPNQHQDIERVKYISAVQPTLASFLADDEMLTGLDSSPGKDSPRTPSAAIPAHTPTYADFMDGLPRGSVLGGRYRILEEIGSGGMARVYRGHHNVLNRPVAIKVLKKIGPREFRTVDRFLQEARFIAQLDHPNVVKIHDIGTEVTATPDGEEYHWRYLVMEWIDGESLEVRLARRTKLTVMEVLDIGIQCARGLAAVHQMGIVHRDTKPGNVLIAQDGRVRLTDFGIAKAELEPVTDMTHESHIVGTPKYLAPEQIEGEVDPRTDLFTLAITLFEALTGHVPFEARTFHMLVHEVMTKPFPSVRELNAEVPERFDQLLREMGAREKHKRPESPDYVAEVLEEIRQDHCQIVGIDLGTTNSALARFGRSGRAEIVPNRDNDRTTPSVVGFEEDGTVVVGKIALHSAMIYPERTVQHVKRHIGDPDWLFSLGRDAFTPEAISAVILRRLIADAEMGAGLGVQDVVLTVPAYFNDKERKATEDAGRIAGLNVVGIINEPVAALLAYGVARQDEAQTVVVYDLGGGTFDVSVVRVDHGEFTVLATDGERWLGGVDWDDVLINYVADIFKAETGADPRTEAVGLQELRDRCVNTKHVLSRKSQAMIACSFRGFEQKVEITRERFDELTAHLLDQTKALLGRTLDKARVEVAQVDKVLCVGGATRMPQVQTMLQDLFQKAPVVSLNPDEVVAMGAAYYGALLQIQREETTGIAAPLSPRLRALLGPVRLNNVTAHSLGILATRKDHSSRFNHIMIPAQTPLPAEQKALFETARDGQVSVQVDIVEGEDESPNGCITIGTLHITNLSPRPAGARIVVSYQYDSEGRITITAVDKESGQTAKVEIARIGMSPDRIQHFRDLIGAMTID